MTNDDNYNMSDFMQEEVAVRDHLLRKAHAAPNVQRELGSFWAKISEGGKMRGEPSVDASDEKLSEDMSSEETFSDDVTLENRSFVRRFAIPAILAVAASIALVLFLYLGKRNHGMTVPEGAVVAYEVDAENAQTGVTLQKGDEEPMSVSANQASCAKVYTNNPNPNSSTTIRNILTTPVNATAEVTLSDGTIVTVNAGSKLVYPQSFSGTTREVELQGEAYFQVHHDAKHPFLVKANGISTKVLGTEFNVRSRSRKDTHVTLLQGSVLVSSAATAKRLKPGEDACFKDGKMTIRSVDTEEYTAWKNGEFYFDNETLLDIAKEIGKWYNVSVIFQSPAKMQTRLFFAAPRDGGIEELLEVLNSLDKAKFTYHNGQVVIE